MTSSDTRQTYVVSSWLFARVLGALLLIAFVSLGVQAKGLFGSTGVMPISILVEQAKSAGHGFWQHPSALWWGSGDTMIGLVWIVGAIASFALLLGLVPKLALAVSWFTYLSFVSLGWPFMSFQWDVLLLEVSFTAFFFMPLRFWDRPGGHPAPHRIARWALLWLLFRLVFRSAWVKIASGDATWADLSALRYHYWTQPLPTSLAWYANQLPEWFQTLSCGLMFAVELGAPVLLLLPWAWARRSAAAAIVFLMILIGLTGNYGFFNLCTIALCIPLLDDRLLAQFARSRFDATPAPDRKTKWNAWPGVAPALVILFSSAIFVSGTFGPGAPRWLAPIYPFSTINNYGLFAVMTTERPEIEIEGTLDGQSWKAYRFRYKPGPLERPPVWNSPHQPRLDWQMWFAALGDYRRNAWLGNLMRRLLQGEPTVLRLLDENPFEGEPPKQIRAVVYRYEFTDWDERKTTGHWWKRRDPALYAPILGVEIARPSTEE
ncbi:MAG: lipase maturation factor family protein [Deltaproteobacteria bacterium]|nr:MAG: lipase maturation factor family protein [Deltaproteobacteria bacterium]